MNMVTRKIYLSILLGLAGLIFVTTQSIAAERETVYTGVTTGKQKVAGHNIQSARQKAESDALGIALQNAFGSLVSSPVFASNLDFFYNRILPKTMDYIVTYKVLGSLENKGYYLVGVESKVDLRRLERTLIDAGILDANKNRPVLLFFISELTPADVRPRIWWEDADQPYHSLAEQIITDQMGKERFAVVGNGLQRPDPGFYDIRFQSVQDIDAAIDLGRRTKAEMIIFGSVVSEEAINRMGEDRTFNAAIHLDGYNVVTGDKAVISRIEAVAASQRDDEGSNRAIAKAAELSARDLIDRIDTYWAQYLRKEQSFEVLIQGDKFHPRYLALTRRFKQIPQIESVQPKELGTGHGILDMFYKGSASQFANALMLQTFNGFGLEFIHVSDERVEIQLIGKKEPDPLGMDENTP